MTKGQRELLQQKSTSERQPFYDYASSEADKMSPEEYKIFKIQVFNAIHNVQSTSRRQVLPKRSVTVTTESQKVGILPPAAQPSNNSQTTAASGSSYSVYYTPSPNGFGNSPSVNLQMADERSRHSLSGILSQLPDLSSLIIDQQQQPQLLFIIMSALSQQQQPP